MAKRNFTGGRIERSDHSWGSVVTGKLPDILAAGLIEPEWAPDPSQRHKNGRVVRTATIIVGGRWVKTRVDANGCCSVFFLGEGKSEFVTQCLKYATDSGGPYDGNAKVAWAECAWQPARETVRATRRVRK